MRQFFFLLFIAFFAVHCEPPPERPPMTVDPEHKKLETLVYSTALSALTLAYKIDQKQRESILRDVSKQMKKERDVSLAGFSALGRRINQIGAQVDDLQSIFPVELAAPSSVDEAVSSSSVDEATAPSSVDEAVSSSSEDGTAHPSSTDEAVSSSSSTQSLKDGESFEPNFRQTRLNELEAFVFGGEDSLLSRVAILKRKRDVLKGLSGQIPALKKSQIHLTPAHLSAELPESEGKTDGDRLNRLSALLYGENEGAGLLDLVEDLEMVLSAVALEDEASLEKWTAVLSAENGGETVKESASVSLRLSYLESILYGPVSFWTLKLREEISGGERGMSAGPSFGPQ